jgi:hypothetical protein
VIYFPQKLMFEKYVQWWLKIKKNKNCQRNGCSENLYFNFLFEKIKWFM